MNNNGVNPQPLQQQINNTPIQQQQTQSQSLQYPTYTNNIMQQQPAQNMYNPYNQVGYSNSGYVQPQQQFWNVPQVNQNAQTPEQANQEFILMDGSAPNKKRKYVYVGEVNTPLNYGQAQMQSFTLDDIRNIIAKEFDIRFGEEKK